MAPWDSGLLGLCPRIRPRTRDSSADNDKLRDEMRQAMQAQTLATSVTQPWAKNNLFKAHVTRIKSKSMEAAGILRHVANLISSDPQATLKQGTSVGYLCVCSSGSNDVTSGFQLTRSKFTRLATSCFYRIESMLAICRQSILVTSYKSVYFRCAPIHWPINPYPWRPLSV